MKQGKQGKRVKIFRPVQHPMPFRWPKSADEYLYHYTSAETALTKILPSRSLRAGRLTTMNDPREAKRWWFQHKINIVDYENPFDAHSQSDLLDYRASAIAKYIQNSCRIIAFVQDDITKRTDDVDCPVGRGFGHPAVWASYGRLHRGLCLIFHKKRLEVCASKVNATPLQDQSAERVDYWFDAVEYQDRYADGDPENERAFSLSPEFGYGDGIVRRKDEGVSAEEAWAAYRHVKRNSEKLLFEKATDWSYEREFRIAFWNEGAGDVSINFDGALAGIVVGEDFGQAADGSDLGRLGYEKNLRRLCKELRVKAYGIYHRSGHSYLKPFFRRPDEDDEFDRFLEFGEFEDN